MDLVDIVDEMNGRGELEVCKIGTGRVEAMDYFHG
jgi:hypothetical protein